METFTAKHLIETFYREGLYAEKQILASKEESLKGEFKSIMAGRESSKGNFSQGRLVAFYRPMPSYEVDTEGLKEYLYDTGLLAQVAKFPVRSTPIEIFSMLDAFSVKKGSVRVNPNKNGRVQIPTHHFSDLGEEELGLEFLKTHARVEELKSEFMLLKQRMMKCDELTNEGRVKHEFGSLSYSEKVLYHKTTEIAQELGMDFLLEHASIDFDRLNNLTYKGSINKSTIDAFRTITDVRLDFVVQPAEVRDKVFQFMSDKKEYLRLQSIG